jgi:hypothetical protein
VRATGLLKRFFPRLAAMESILPKITRQSFGQNYPTEIPAQTEKRYRVGVILGCVQRLFFSPVNEATVRVLTANGCEVVIPQSQGCCAALPAHQGQEVQAQALARQMIDSFAETEVDFIIKDINNNKVVCQLNNQSIFRYWLFYYSNIYLQKGKYQTSIVESQSKRIIFNDILEVK